MKMVYDRVNVQYERTQGSVTIFAGYIKQGSGIIKDGQCADGQRIFGMYDDIEQIVLSLELTFDTQNFLNQVSEFL